MFTGIIQAKGVIQSIDRAGDWKIAIKPPESFGLPQLGASIACDGICLTVIEADKAHFVVQVSGETLSKTTAASWDSGRALNLEPALRMGDELGGHIVTGHVDGLARVVAKAPDGDSVRFTFEIPDSFSSFVAPKGSVALDGISLTVNEVDANRFGVNIIPFTQQETTIGARAVGDMLNFEVDPLARYVARMRQVEQEGERS